MARTKVPAGSPILNQVAERIGETLGTVAARTESLKEHGADVIKVAATAARTARKAVKRVTPKAKAAVKKAQKAVKTAAKRMAKASASATVQFRKGHRKK